jgi:hypothetical protein
MSDPQPLTFRERWILERYDPVRLRAIEDQEWASVRKGGSLSFILRSYVASWMVLGAGIAAFYLFRPSKEGPALPIELAIAIGILGLFTLSAHVLGWRAWERRERDYLERNAK